jgi:hypothetical protein
MHALAKASLPHDETLTDIVVANPENPTAPTEVVTPTTPTIPTTPSDSVLVKTKATTLKEKAPRRPRSTDSKTVGRRPRPKQLNTAAMFSQDSMSPLSAGSSSTSVL